MIVERKYLAHFIDANMVHDGNGSTNYVRLGKHLESYAEELNPQVEQFKNILGEPVVLFNGYEPQSSVDKYYAETGDPLYEKLKTIAMERWTGDDCRTTCVDAIISIGTETTIEEAYREDCYIAVQSFGGDTSGVQIPFQIIKAGNRKRVNFYNSGGSWYAN